MFTINSSNYARLKQILVIFAAELGDPNDENYKTLVYMQVGLNVCHGKIYA